MFWYRKKKNLPKKMLLYALRNSTSIQEAAAFLNVNYQTFLKYSRLHKDADGDPLTKYYVKQRKLAKISKTSVDKKATKINPTKARKVDKPLNLELIEKGKTYTNKHSALRKQYLEVGALRDECYICGFSEKRIGDYDSPLKLIFKDGNKTHQSIENLELVCLNCEFLYYPSKNTIIGQTSIPRLNVDLDFLDDEYKDVDDTYYEE